MVTCEQATDLDQQSDHWSVTTTFDISIVPAAPTTYPDFKRIDVTGFLGELEAKFRPRRDLDTKEALDEATANLMDAIRTASLNHSPTKRFTKFTRQGIDKESST